MKLIVSKNLIEAEQAAIDCRHSLTADSSSRRAAAAVILPEYLVTNWPEVAQLAPWRWPLPDGSVYLNSAGERCCTAEFTYLLMARVLPVAQLALFALELCGTYTVDWHDSRGFVPDTVPQTSVQKLHVFLDGCPQAPGSNRAKEALRWVADRSASPMESCLVLLLCLPMRLGGFGLPMPELNAEPDYTAQARALAGHKRVFNDLFWRVVRFGIEYESDLEHTGADRIARDSKRRVVLNALNITSVSVTNEQIKDADELAKVARLAARALGRRINRINHAFKQRHKSLREDLFALTRAPEA